MVGASMGGDRKSEGVINGEGAGDKEETAASSTTEIAGFVF
jgi:hypothetical protein